MWEREFQQPPVLASFPLEFPGRPSCSLAMCSRPTKHISVSFTGQKEKKVNIKTKTQKGRYENRRPKNTRTTNSERALKLHKLVDPQVEIACLAAKFHHRSPKICSTTKMFSSQLSFWLGSASIFFPRFSLPNFPRLLSSCCHTMFACPAKGELGSRWLATSFSALCFPSLAQATPANLKPLFPAFLGFSPIVSKILGTSCRCRPSPLHTPYCRLIHGPTR